MNFSSASHQPGYSSFELLPILAELQHNGRCCETGSIGTVLSMSLRNRVHSLRPLYDNRQYGQTFYNRSPVFYWDDHEEVEARVHGWHQRPQR